MVPQVLRKGRSEGRPFRLGPAFFFCALTVLAACGGPPRSSDPRANPIDPGVFFEYSKLIKDYIAALLLLNSENPADWKEAKVRLEVMAFSYFQEDRELIETFRTGTPETSEIARKELGRRGRMLDLILVFAGPHAPATWEHARRELLALAVDGDAHALLTISLIKILLNGNFRDVWPHIRYQLVEVGDVALETTAEVARQRADATPETPIWKQDDLVQLIMVLIAFGEKGRPPVVALSQHRTWNVRKAAAKAIGDSIDVSGAEILVGYLHSDPEWQVKATAAEALGQLRPGRRTLGPILIERMKVERDAFVLRAILRAIGRLGNLDAIPFLMNAIDVPNYETASVAMEALYDLTGERLTTPTLWKRWYRESYPTWIKGQNP